MHFETFADFINMGGHGLFVWSVYGFGIGVLLFNVVRPSILQKQFFQQQSRLLKAGMPPETTWQRNPETNQVKTDSETNFEETREEQ